jgi:hypothetical protein
MENQNFSNRLDKVFAKKGEMIGSLLIVGGPEVVPFHRLPNPTDDLDDEVLSDSPYSTRDSNYFVPEWPVSRIPGGKGPMLDCCWSRFVGLPVNCQSKNKMEPEYVASTKSHFSMVSAAC